jgi:hypothetical protein
MSTTIPRDGLPDGAYELFEPTDASRLAALMIEALVQPPVRHEVTRGDGTGWEPLLSALVD